MKFKSKIIDWLKRYFPAEVFAIIGVTAGGTVCQYIFHNSALTAIGATVGENIGFYGKIIYKDTQDRWKRDQEVTFLGFLKVTRNTVVEFGLAEYLDLIIRPSTMYFFLHIMRGSLLGILIGKLFADITFYTPAIVFYELRKKFLTD